ncbi:MAG TPA: sodium:proton antiporter NhaD, partial [Roseiflexaceae bacterium]|nr:sodium:proton antiporter NhaD [Roseiflexaceae bacterium]
LEVTAAEIFSVVIFLLAAMTLVEVLTHYQFFDYVRVELSRHRLRDRQQFIVIGAVAFLLSAVIDNLTTTIVMITIAQRFFRGRNLLVMAAAVIIFANAGGAWSPIGDITTLMLWLSGKFSASQVMLDLLLPSLAHAVVAGLLLIRQITDDTPDSSEDLPVVFALSEFIVIGLALAGFGLPLLMSRQGLPPYMGLLIGLAIVWIVSRLLARVRPRETHLTADIEQLLRNVDMPSLKFFIGILLAVAALNQLGVLTAISTVLLGSNAGVERIVIGNSALGVLSAIVDNVPLTALAINLLPTSDARLWTLLAYCVGTGGSLLVIGSAAGVIAMGMIRGLSSTVYMRIATVPVVLAYCAGMIVWGLQRLITGA